MGNIGSTNPSRAASWRSVPAGNGALLSKISRSAARCTGHPRGDRVGGHVPARGQAVLVRNAPISLESQTRSQDGDRSGRPDRGQAFETLNGDSARVRAPPG